MTAATKVAGLGPRTPVNEAGRKLLEARLADAERLLSQALRSLGPGEVHDLRVAVRRLRAAMKLFGKRRLRRHDEAVQRLQHALGELRDLHLVLAWLRDCPQDELAAALGKEKEAELPGREAKLRRALSFFAVRTLPRLLRSVEEVRRKGRLGGGRLRGKLSRRVEDAEETLRAARSLKPDAVHALRLAGKKLRYQAELLEPAFPKPLGSLLQELASLQDTLGKLHDLDVRIALIERHAAQGGKPDRRGAALRGRAAAAPLLSEVRAERSTRARSCGSELARWTGSARLRSLRKSLA